MGHATTKLQNLIKLRTILFQYPQGIDVAYLVQQIGIDRASVFRYLQEIEATSIKHGVWTLDPTPEDIELAHVILARVDEP